MKAPGTERDRYLNSGTQQATKHKHRLHVDYREGWRDERVAREKETKAISKGGGK